MNQVEDIKKEFGELYYTVMDILYKNDPVGICVGTNLDEYEHEVIEILPRLKDVHNPIDLGDIIYQLIVNEFGDIIAGKKSRYCNIAHEIWDAYQKKLKTTTTASVSQVTK